MTREELNRAFVALARHYEAGRAICGTVARGGIAASLDVGQICTRARIASARAFEVEEFLRDASACGLFQQVSARSFGPVLGRDEFEVFEHMFAGVELYRRNVHRDQNEVEVVLSKPPAPSKFTEALDRSLQGAWGLQPTAEVFPQLAVQARQRFTVMTPFLDSDGAERLLRLFESAGPDVSRELIVRFAPTGLPPEGLPMIWPTLRALGVRIYDFRLAKEQGAETFHAKVVVADDQATYVGSSNMTWSSFAHSLELGILVRGREASRIRQIVDAVIEVARPVSAIT